jgi:DNA invertase Pin-like site-specific DNA recombinase
MTNQIKGSAGAATSTNQPLPVKVAYCLYARKSTESEEQQVLSIDSQIKEMIQIAERDGLTITEIRKESHSAKAVGQREVFNELLKDIRSGKFNGILTWAPDRLSRNAGDLGSLVDLMDQKALVEIRTFSQKFTNNPSEKFMLMILCSTAKLENDNKSENVKRDLRTRCEQGLRPSMAPTGYLNEKRKDISELGIRQKFKDEISRYNKFRKIALGKKREKSDPEEFDAKSYAVYLLTEGSIAEKRELLSNLKSRLILKDRVITIEAGSEK